MNPWTMFARGRSVTDARRVVVTRLGDASAIAVVCFAALLFGVVCAFWSHEPSSRDDFAWWIGLGVVGPVFVPMVRWGLTRASARRVINVPPATGALETLRRAGVAPWHVAAFNIAPYAGGVSIALSDRREKACLVAVPGVECAAISGALEELVGRPARTEIPLGGHRRGFVLSLYVAWVAVFGGGPALASFSYSAWVLVLISAILWPIMIFVELAMVVAVFVIPFYDRRRRLVLEREHLVCEPRTLLRMDRLSRRWSVVDDAVWIRWRQVHSIDVVKVRGRRRIVVDAEDVFAIRYVYVPFRWPNVLPELAQIVAHMKEAQRAHVEGAPDPGHTPYRGRLL